MNSSTSNSSRTGRRHIVVALLLLFIGLESGMRLYYFRYASGSAWVAFRARSEELKRHSGTRVVLVGNSVTADGVDLATFESALRSGGMSGAKAAELASGGTDVNIWYFWLEHFVWQRGLKPDLIVIPFFGDDLADQPSRSADEIAHLVPLRQWPEVFVLDLPDLPRKVEFLLAWTSVTYTMRDQLKKRILAGLVPDYKRYREHINEVNCRKRQRERESQADRTTTYRQLERLLRRAQETHSRICFVAYPERGWNSGAPSGLDRELTRRIREARMDLIDLRTVPELTSDQYKDHVHLIQSAWPTWSRRLGAAVAEVAGDRNR